MLTVWSGQRRVLKGKLNNLFQPRLHPKEVADLASEEETLALSLPSSSRAGLPFVCDSV